MQINSMSVRSYLFGEQQFVIPIYHRQYVWTEAQWGIFWDDVSALCEDVFADPYFIGNIVVKPLATQVRQIKKLSIIDGQQRLITISILLAALRDLYIADESQAEAKKEIKRLNNLISNSASYEIDEAEYPKIIFGSDDTEATKDFLVIIAGHYKAQTISKETSLIAKAYLFFLEKIKKSDFDLTTISDNITEKLCVANIELDPIADNPDFVFESLNATGLKLSSIDLIRNSFFMDIPLKQQADLYNKYWLPIEEELGYDKDFTDFIRVYIAKDGAGLEEKKFYQYLRKEITKAAQEKLKEVHYFFKIYQILKKPALAKNEAIEKQLERINALSRVVANPFLINCFNDYQQGVLTETALLQVLKIIENYSIRITFCNSQKGDIKFFALIYKEVQNRITNSTTPLSFVQALKNVLGAKNYPNDSYFKKCFTFARMNISRGLEPKLALFMLKEIEQKYAHKERLNLDESELVFILPKKTIDNLPQWQIELGDDWQELHTLYSQTFINCTLAPKKATFDEHNNSFSLVKAILSHSNLHLNKEICTHRAWTEEVLLNRANMLADQAIALWPYFGENGEVGFEVKQTFDKLIFLKKEFDIKSWRDVFRYTIERLFEVFPASVDTVLAKFPQAVSKNKAKFKEAIPVGLDCFIERENRQGARIEQQCRNLIEDLALGDNWKITYKDKI